MSNEYFSVDGTLIEAWASAKSFRRSWWIGAEKTHFEAQFVGSAWNLIGMSKLSLAEANQPLQPATA